jgi:hypothetical protein
VIFINTLSKYLFFLRVLVYYQHRQSEPGIIILVNVVLKKIPDLKSFIEIIMKLKFAVAVVALSSIFNAANAATTYIDVVLNETSALSGTYTNFFGNSNVLTGAFDNTFKFIFNPILSGDGKVTNLSVSSISFDPTISGLNFSSAALNGINILTGTVPLGGGSASIVGITEPFNFSGPLSLHVMGNALDNSSYGGGITVLASASTPPLSPVPEPETYAMMLAGLGLLGFAARRKAKADKS